LLLQLVDSFQSPSLHLVLAKAVKKEVVFTTLQRIR
jgi:hypothetical protein